MPEPLDEADKLLAELLTSKESEAVYNRFGPDVAFLLDKVQEKGRHTSVPQEVRQRLFKALREAIPDDDLFDPTFGLYFWAHLAVLYRQAYLDQVPNSVHTTSAVTN
ncbi:MAG: hypothetical protein ACR2NN_20755 [Bryobacteraceae bacterium]